VHGCGARIEGERPPVARQRRLRIAGVEQRIDQAYAGCKADGFRGVRGRVGVWPITPEFVLKLGWAVGKVLARQGNGKVLIGKDTRISGYMFESVLESGLSAAGIDTLLLGPMPTPAIAYLTRTLRAQAGIVISASHNPYYDNGIKLFDANGSKLPDEKEFAIEAHLEQPLRCVDSKYLGKATRIDDAAQRYIDFCLSTLKKPLDLKKYKIEAIEYSIHGQPMRADEERTGKVRREQATSELKK
jgi:phosphomannomutase